jgi:hypothetical protein
MSVAVLALLAACGGGGESSGSAPISCSVADQKNWLKTYFNDTYFWYTFSPNPNPSAFSTVGALFGALLYTGTNARFPADRWSSYGSTTSFNQFFIEGQTLGYGISVAGLEVDDPVAQPLYVRYVEPLSPAAGAGVVRGDRVVSINGRAASDWGAADLSVLSPTSAGQQITLVLQDQAGTDRTVMVASAPYVLSPLPYAQVVTTSLGRKLGYLFVKDMITQVDVPMATAFAAFNSNGVSDVVVDLRYNGGGLVTVGAALASYVAGSRAAGQIYASLLFNDKLANANNRSATFSSPTSALGVPRAYVLTGRRTCSASEQVINGLRGAGIEVVIIGETTCGKPVGFVAQEDGCGTTYGVVNFESVNARNEGRYFGGFAPTCPVAEDFTMSLGASNEPLLAAARTMADGGACPVAAVREKPTSRRTAPLGVEPGERQEMILR